MEPRDYTPFILTGLCGVMLLLAPRPSIHYTDPPASFRRTFVFGVASLAFVTVWFYYQDNKKRLEEAERIRRI